MGDAKDDELRNKVDRCTGHCCKRFPLPYDYEEIQRRQDKIIDGEQIAAMIVPLNKTVDCGDVVKHLFTCKNLQSDGDCSIYDSRPRMCSDYPYGRQCGLKECTWSVEGQINAMRLRKSIYGN